MKNRTLLIKLAVLVTAMLCALGASADEAYACYTPSNTTLTFYYDNYRDSRPGTTYLITAVPGWYTDETYMSVTRVVFDSSFAGARPTSTSLWFAYMRNLVSITGMNYLNTVNVTDMHNMFSYCSSLTSLDVSHFNTANVTDMHDMFYGCSSLTSLDVSHFNTANVTDMRFMFDECSSLTSLDVSHFNTANVKWMEAMFYGCSSLTSLDVSHFNTAKVTDFTIMFGGCSSLTSLDVTNFNTANATTMRRMFLECSSLTSLDLTNFNTANVTDMNWMFRGCNSLASLDVSSFNTAKVTDMCWMFYGCSSLTSLDVSNFSTANVTDMTFMFCGCSNLTRLDLTNFNTANVTDMNHMFSGCRNLTNINLSSFNTANVTNLEYMFNLCGSLTRLDLSSFNTSKVTNTCTMFMQCTSLTTIYVGSGWNMDAVTVSVQMFSQCANLVGGKGTRYTYGHTEVEYAHIDGGPSNPGYLTDINDLLCGDVNGDGSVNISDVTALIDYLLGSGSATPAADVNGDGSVNIIDVTTLIDCLLTGVWPSKTFTVNGVSFKMVTVAGGIFTMGSDESVGTNGLESPAHQVTLSTYSIGETEVTQELWVAVMGSNPSGNTGNLKRPVDNVNWNDCQTFITKLNQLTGKTFRLPTEAEWEFAARGGNRSNGYLYSGSNSIGNVAWYQGNASSASRPVATKAPNELGLYDMSGNVWEWCQDWLDTYSSESQVNPQGPSSGRGRTCRGGAYNRPAYMCLNVNRTWDDPTARAEDTGLRIAL